MELITARLVLRPWLDSDATELYALARDPRIGTAAGWPPHESEEQSLDILRNVLRGPEQYAVTLRCDGTLIGAIGLKTIDDCDYLEGPDEYSAGYWIGAPHWGKGYAPEAFSALIEHAQRDLGARAMYADHFLDNAQSHRVMEKCGLKPLRTAEVSALYPESSREVLIMQRELRPDGEANGSSGL